MSFIYEIRGDVSRPKCIYPRSAKSLVSNANPIICLLHRTRINFNFNLRDLAHFLLTDIIAIYMRPNDFELLEVSPARYKNSSCV